jgi:hypothetical protein
VEQSFNNNINYIHREKKLLPLRMPPMNCAVLFAAMANGVESDVSRAHEGCGRVEHAVAENRPRSLMCLEAGKTTTSGNFFICFLIILQIYTSVSKFIKNKHQPP